MSASSQKNIDAVFAACSDTRWTSTADIMAMLGRSRRAVLDDLNALFDEGRVTRSKIGLDGSRNGGAQAVWKRA